MSKRDLCIMACVFCKDPQFWAWLESIAAEAGLPPTGPADTFDEKAAKAFIITTCQIDSRNELDTDQRAADLFHLTVRQPFLAWKAGLGEEGDFYADGGAPC